MVSRKFFLVIVALFVIPLAALHAQQNVSAPRKFALVIGNGTYTNVTRLKNPVNDANDMAAVLQNMGFQVEKILNGDLIQMTEAAVRLKNRLSTDAASYGFFFYAGHGVQSNGENYLIPVDANILSESYLPSQALQVQAVLNDLNWAGNTLNIVVLDACRDNPFSWSRGSSSRGLQAVNVQPASIIVFATSAGATAADGTGQNGVFTGQLLKNLKITGLEVNEVFRRTGADVSQVSNGKQVPAIYSQFFGTAYLNGPATVTPEPSPQPAAPAPQPGFRPFPAPPRR
ncbi:MAG: caspase family protein [Treponema sp.]|nr:caspase family protein [Treponema sp.]